MNPRATFVVETVRSHGADTDGPNAEHQPAHVLVQLSVDDWEALVRWASENHEQKVACVIPPGLVTRYGRPEWVSMTRKRRVRLRARVQG